MKNTMKKKSYMFTTRMVALLLSLVLLLAACGGGSSSDKQNMQASQADQESKASQDKEVVQNDETGQDIQADLSEATIYIDIAASLEAVFADVIIPAYEEANPNIKIEYNTGSSGALLSGIEEANGIGHDLFFSAGKSQVTSLDETDGLVAEDSIVELLSNQLCLVKAKGGETSVGGWDSLGAAKSMALCPGSVPVGKYSRIAMVSLGILAESEDPSVYTAEEIKQALGGQVELDEADDVEIAAAKVVEGSCEVATIYYSDYYNHKDDLEIIAQDDGSLTGKIIYPVCLVKNPEATEAETAAAADFLAFLQTDICLKAYEEYCFVVNH